MKTLIKIKDYSDKIKNIIDFLDKYEYVDGVSPKRKFACLYNVSGDNEQTVILDSTVINIFPEVVFKEFYNILEIIKEDINIKKAWIALYPPKDGLDFHFDNTNRVIMNLNRNDEFYYMELNPPKVPVVLNGEKLPRRWGGTEYCEYMQTVYKKLEFDKFLEEAKLNEENNVLKLDLGCVYTYDEPVSYSFYNNSENKIRISLIFDL